ncbi:chaperonin 10-like protein [Lophiotrema nucula]|uniref:Chaperonin 10-like protein n=1 Tax=Lophiotrema nucula TaxID=690887 RepID=A0A6A5YR49_9PLEO|nr:chaperonin 10-like protein [Lophiotrema nucula]
MPSNKAAYLLAAKSPFEFHPAPLTQPKPHQLLIRTRAIALNPIDAKVHRLAFFPLTYPVILGQDVAGEVVEIGPDVSRFKVGERVFGLAAGSYDEPEQKAFQEFVVLREDLAARVPEGMSWERAVVLPLGVCTATAGLFLEQHLGLKLPVIEVGTGRRERERERERETVLVWGGAGSVGGNAVQLATKAGYEVLSTCSPGNFEIVRGLGAREVFDYLSPTVVQDIVSALQRKRIAGILDAVGGAEAWKFCVEILKGVEGRKYIATVLPTSSFAPSHDDGIEIEQVQALSIKDTDVGKHVWEFLGKALEEGKYETAPEPLVAGRGLESLGKAVDVMWEGVSARKVVVVLD